MVGGTQKPFACTFVGCTMTFTNEDHLNVHQKKHEMVLNLGNKSNIIVADQTPTPTRFLRNCEEVGLFQDLQNVNPFDETFRRAVEMVKTGSLPEPDLPEDDTLHTPHVFPHLPAENVSLMYNNHRKNNESILTPHIVLIDDTNLPIKTPESHNLPDNSDHVYAMDTDKHIPTKSITINHDNMAKNNKTTRSAVVNKSNITKTKLKQILLKRPVKIAVQKEPNVFLINSINTQPNLADNKHLPNIPTITIVSNIQKPIYPKFESINVNTEAPEYQAGEKTKPARITKPPKRPESLDPKKLEMLERNRASAMRSRERKKERIGTLESKFESVCDHNMELQKEVNQLRNEVKQLKSLLLAHKECSVTKAMDMGKNIPIGLPQIIIPLVKRKPEPDRITIHRVETTETSDTRTIDLLTESNKNVTLSPKTSVIVLNDSYNDLHT